MSVRPPMSGSGSRATQLRSSGTAASPSSRRARRPCSCSSARTTTERVEDVRVARVLIVNPFASGVSERRLAAVQAALPAGTETVLTQARGDATELAAEWSPLAEAIYVFSGDGTYNEVINGLRADIPVGFVPGGGTSVLPRALGLPRDPARAAARIAHRDAAAHLARPHQRPHVRVQRRHRVRRGARPSRRREGPPRGRQAARRPRVQPGPSSGARRPSVPVRAGARGRGARPGRVRADRQLLAVHVRRSRSASVSSPARPSRAASTSSRRSRCAPRAVPRLATQALRGRPRRRRRARRPRPRPDRDPLRRAAAGAGRRRGHRRREEAEIVAVRDALTVLT